MSEIKLKACPFCGAVPSGVHDYFDGRGEFHYVVNCTNDDCPTDYMVVGEDATAESAASKWNTRAPQWQGIESAPKVIDKVIWAFQSVNGRPWSYECIWNGFYWYHGFGDAFPDANPTHWQPLPAPPEV